MLCGCVAVFLSDLRSFVLTEISASLKIYAEQCEPQQQPGSGKPTGEQLTLAGVPDGSTVFGCSLKKQ